MTTTTTTPITLDNVARQTQTVFQNAKGTEMTVRMTKGKTAISLRVALLVNGQEKAVTGARERFDLNDAGAAAAKQAYKALVETAKAKGWVRASQPGKVREDAFTEIPDACDEAAIAAVAPKAEEKPAASKAKAKK